MSALREGTRKAARSQAAVARSKEEARQAKTAWGHTWLDLLLLGISGALMATAFPGFDWWILSVPAMILLVAVVDRVSPGRAFVYSAWWAMFFMMPLISWMQIATDGTLIAWVALAGAEAFFIGLWGLSFATLRTWGPGRTMWGQALGGALLWVTFEEARSRSPFSGFPWGKVAYPQVNGPLISLSQYGGEVLVGFCVVLIAILLRHAFSWRASKVGESGFVGRASAALFALVLFVAPALIPLAKNQENGSLEVAVIQGNVEMPMNETFATPRKVTGNHARQTMKMLDDGHSVDLILWGENSTDIDPRADEGTYALVQEVSQRSGVPLMIGILEYSDPVRYNWAAIWDPNTGLVEPMYGKQKPVPWGEYVPFRQITEFLATAAAQVTSDMVPVDNPGIMDVTLSDGRVVPIAVGICFEVAYEPLIAEGVALGGQMIVIPTNNAHFQNSAESDQQLQMARFRAAQFSRATVQVSTNGVSAIVSPDGNVTAKTGTQEAAYLVGSLPLRTSKTPFTYIASWFPVAVMAGGLAAATANVVTYVSRSRSGAAPVLSGRK